MELARVAMKMVFHVDNIADAKSKRRAVETLGGSAKLLLFGEWIRPDNTSIILDGIVVRGVGYSKLEVQEDKYWIQVRAGQSARMEIHAIFP